MGEARRKLDADACGIPRPRDDVCPSCHSRKVFSIPQESWPEGISIDCEWQGCIECSAVWEAFPPVYARDPVCAEPCDNCAFRPGSPEQADPVKWRALLDTLKPHPSGFGFTGKFYCHKGVPIDQTKGPGNFLFPQKPMLIDGEPVRRADGSIATTEDPAQMRTCTGFLRMVWARTKKVKP
jgi:hypothetical protein